MRLHWRWRGLRGLLVLALLLADLPALASSLAAWRVTRQGVLELRTTPDVALQAFYEAGDAGRGPRVWVDLPGAPQRTRSIRGSGSIREVRIGRPTPTTTRLVVEFAPGTRLDPRSLRLVGTAPDRWRMEFRGLDRPVLLGLGEGDLDRPSGWAAAPTTPFPTASAPLSADGLPVVPRGRFRVVIDPGHGGPDPGAVGIGGLRETDVVLDVSLQAARLLQARGVQVTLTRTSEIDLDLPPRVSIANRAGADAFVSVHANALSMARPDVNGVETFFFSGGPSQALASALQRRMMAISSGSPNRGVKQGRFFVIRRTVMPAALVEMGFVTGAIDAPRLANPDFRRRMALAIAAGILDFLGGR
ncbi:N-acetylmuramoyl-L-alanine amidase [Cyanobium sp. CH-040]|uniref:N-acetylmuramoyl-L-alanine amidase n=1 Tax=Cyanobium sp. CH-040 TaxID=2823708 RepID=UPI0020CDFAA4|nr:N-acetylmuramoyl-L-alanine amidase [Cyanobium sp. CH-040]MCP9926837.1 N-acetylmuramoyl-L-alanine amidase [Cyanobium sp. CH-040]